MYQLGNRYDVYKIHSSWIHQIKKKSQLIKIINVSSWDFTGLHVTLVLATCINTKLISTRAHIKDTRAHTYVLHSYIGAPTYIHTQLTLMRTRASPYYTQHHSCTHQADIHAELYTLAHTWAFIFICWKWQHRSELCCFIIFVRSKHACNLQ